MSVCCGEKIFDIFNLYLNLKLLTKASPWFPCIPQFCSNIGLTRYFPYFVMFSCFSPYFFIVSSKSHQSPFNVSQSYFIFLCVPPCLPSIPSVNLVFSLVSPTPTVFSMFYLIPSCSPVFLPSTPLFPRLLLSSPVFPVFPRLPPCLPPVFPPVFLHVFPHVPPWFSLVFPLPSSVSLCYSRLSPCSLRFHCLTLMFPSLSPVLSCLPPSSPMFPSVFPCPPPPPCVDNVVCVSVLADDLCYTSVGNLCLFYYGNIST